VTLVTLNGATRELPDGSTVDAVVRAAGAPENGRGVAVAVDGEVLPRGKWATTEIQEGQKVEVLHAVQGGQ
jgi:sulfur carrier protein